LFEVSDAWFKPPAGFGWRRTIERPLSISTIEPSAGQYISQAVQPG